MNKEPMPQTGGSYTRDPVTGEPVLSEQPGEPVKTPDPQPDPAAKPEQPKE